PGSAPARRGGPASRHAARRDRRARAVRGSARPGGCASRSAGRPPRQSTSPREPAPRASPTGYMLRYARRVTVVAPGAGPMEAIPPRLRPRIREVLSLVPADGAALDGVPLERLARLLDDGEPWLGADASLADIGYWMMESRQSAEMRRRGCIWSTMFPSADTARRLARVALDPQTPPPVREQAIWS